MEEILGIIAHVSAFVTLLGFGWGFVWNYRSNQQAKRANMKMCKKFAENLINIRKIEIERINAEIEKLERDAETLQKIRDLKISNAKPEEESALTIEYSAYINNLGFTIIQLKQLATQLGMDAVMDVDSFMKDISD